MTPTAASGPTDAPEAPCRSPEPSESALGRVHALLIYPIKSCQSVSVHEARIGPGGFVGDRRYMLVDPQGRFLSQRQCPQLARVSCSVEGDDITANVHDRRPLRLPQNLTDGEERRCRIWRDEVIAKEFAHGSRWFSEFLGRSVHLVYLPEESLRQINPRRALPGERVSLADGYPLLWTNESSLADLNRRLEHPVSMARFRPNLVSSGHSPYVEDKVKKLRIGTIDFSVPKLCDRCVVITTDQTTGDRQREPLKTLSSYRKWDGAVWFGANLIPKQEGPIKLGDPIRLLEFGSPPI